MKSGLPVLLIGLLLAGCATSSVESRRRERAAGHVALSSEMSTFVDQEQIRRGVNEDAVYIAWGKPAQIVQQEDANGLQTI